MEANPVGDRANCAIRENGRIELYYSHWGARSIAEDIFWGPARTESFIRANEPTADWLDEVWAEGGVPLDKDNRQLSCFYSQWPDEEDIRRVYESLLGETWQVSGWSVRRALIWQDLVAAGSNAGSTRGRSRRSERRRCISTSLRETGAKCLKGTEVDAEGVEGRGLRSAFWKTRN